MLQGPRGYDPIQIPRLPKDFDDRREPMHRTFHNEAIYRAIRARLHELDEFDELELDMNDDDDCSCEELAAKVATMTEAIDLLTTRQRVFHQELQHLSQSDAFHNQHLQQQMSNKFDQFQNELRRLHAIVRQPVHHPIPKVTWQPTDRHSRQRYSRSAQVAFSLVQLLGFASFFFILAYVAVGLLGLEPLQHLLEGVSWPVFQSLAVVTLVSFAAASLLEAMRNR